MNKENNSEIDYSLVNDDFHPFPLKESTRHSLHVPELSTSGLSGLGPPCPDPELEPTNLSIQDGLDVSPPKYIFGDYHAYR